jgi:hypothetical protein
MSVYTFYKTNKTLANQWVARFKNNQERFIPEGVTLLPSPPDAYVCFDVKPDNTPGHHFFWAEATNRLMRRYGLQMVFFANPYSRL